MGTSEITEPKYDNQYWITYWTKMNKKLNSPHFNPQLRGMKVEIENTGCGGNYWMNGLNYECQGKRKFSTRLCKNCEKLIKQINDANHAVSETEDKN